MTRRSENKRWPASRKRNLVADVLQGVRSRESVFVEHPDISEEEFDGWVLTFNKTQGKSSALGMAALIAGRRTAVPA